MVDRMDLQLGAGAKRSRSAGTARNQIPERAEAGGDVRVMQADSNEKLLAALQAKVKESPLVPDTTTTVTLEPLRPIYVAGDRGRALADLARDIYAELDGRKLLPHFRFADKGVNMKRFFEEPKTFDLVLSITGPGVVPYLDSGPMLTSEEWWALQQQFDRTGFMTFALWAN